MSEASSPARTSLITVFMFSTAFVTPFPQYLALSPSLSSSASNSPVDAPLGAVPLPTVPSARTTSASTVGFPLESSISLPITFSIYKNSIVLLLSFKITHADVSRKSASSGNKNICCIFWSSLHDLF